MTGEVIDLFAGPGGWDRGARALGIDPLGLELDSAACATRDAAGLRTLQVDVALHDPAAHAGAWGIIGSPPCQSFSSGGLGKGADDAPAVFAAMGAMLRGATDQDRVDAWRGMADPRSLLVLEPLRYALAIRPEWIALEQVPAVLPLWRMMGAALHDLGYSVWAGEVNAHDFGVPQARRRAVLLASQVEMVPDPHDLAGIRPELAPSMADALPAWAPGDLVGFPRRNDRPDGGAYRARDLFPASGPAPTLTSKARSWRRFPADGGEPVPVTLEEASTLQGFPAAYPWQGSRSACFLQLANAVPPPLALHLLGTVTDLAPTSPEAPR